MIFTSGIFWGIVLIIVGIAVILKHVLKIDIQVFRIVVACIFILIGANIITKSKQKENKESIVFGNERIKYSASEKEYNCIFGNATIDLSDIGMNETETVQLNCFFGNMDVIIPDDRQVIIESNTTLGRTEHPDGDFNSFGQITYNAGKKDSSITKKLYIETNTVFGNIEIID